MKNTSVKEQFSPAALSGRQTVMIQILIIKDYDDKEHDNKYDDFIYHTI